MLSAFDIYKLGGREEREPEREGDEFSSLPFPVAMTVLKAGRERGQCALLINLCTYQQNKYESLQEWSTPLPMQSKKTQTASLSLNSHLYWWRCTVSLSFSLWSLKSGSMAVAVWGWAPDPYVPSEWAGSLTVCWGGIQLLVRHYILITFPSITFPVLWRDNTTLQEGNFPWGSQAEPSQPSPERSDTAEREGNMMRCDEIYLKQNASQDKKVTVI